jgi:tetratricopeptide (TPR) repeat protein
MLGMGRMLGERSEQQTCHIRRRKGRLLFIFACCAAFLLGSGVTQLQQLSGAPLQQHEQEENQTSRQFGYTPTGDDVIDLLWRRSDGYFHKGDYENAIRLHRLIVQFEPDFTEAYAVGAWLMESLGREKEALSFLQEGLSHNTDNYHLYFEIGFFYFNRKEFAEARKYFGEAIKHEHPVFVARMLAHACEKQGDLQAAREVWRSLLSADPTDAVASMNLKRVEAKIEAHQAR